MSQRIALGIDFGTDSVRALCADLDGGAELATAISTYPRWAEGRYCDASTNRFRQHPLDYLEAMTAAVRETVAGLSTGEAERVVGIGIATTASTPCALDGAGRPLALSPGFADNPNAMFVLWKDHTAQEEADQINALARDWRGQDLTRFAGSSYSPEWFWSKLMHIMRNDPKVGAAAVSWAEHCDWITGLLAGATSPADLKRSVCAAGHKGMWHPSWGGLPPEEFLVSLEPRLKGLRSRLYSDTAGVDAVAGRLSADWAQRLGLPAGIAIAVGAIDAHVGAIGAGVTPGTLVKIVGTSTCDITVVAPETIGGTCIRGISGQVLGSVVPGLVGLVAGQAAFGDVYAWFRDLLNWRPAGATPAGGAHLLDGLSHAAAQLPAAEGPIAVDWFNGRRSPAPDQRLTGAIAGLSLGSSAPRLYRSLVEATAYGARAINEHLAAAGVTVNTVVATGGIAIKSPFVMQVLADVLATPMRVASTEQAVALGAAMCGATAAGQFQSIPEAQDAMAAGVARTYTPDAGRSATYLRGYQRYHRLGAAAAELGSRND